MVVANTITTHLEQMFYELKEDGQIWQDWDAYFNSYLKVDGFKNNWRQNQSTYSHSFRTYVNSKLVQFKTEFPKNKNTHSYTTPLNSTRINLY